MSDDCCDERKKGYVCTLEPGHKGQHEAWNGPVPDPNSRCIIKWGSWRELEQRHKWERPWWGFFLLFDQRCSKCGVRLTREGKGPRGGLTYELRYPDRSKIRVKPRSLPACSGTK